MRQQTPERLSVYAARTDANLLHLSQQRGHPSRLAPGLPLPAEACAQPVGQKADLDVIAHAVWSVVVDGPHFEIRLQFPESGLDFDKTLVVGEHLALVGGIGGKIRLQEVPSVEARLGIDHRLLARYNEDQAAKDRADREAIVAALWEQQKRGDKPSVGNKGDRRNLTSPPNYSGIDEQKIRAEARYDRKVDPRDGPRARRHRGRAALQGALARGGPFPNAKVYPQHAAHLPPVGRGNPGTRLLQLSGATSALRAPAPDGRPGLALALGPPASGARRA